MENKIRLSVIMPVYNGAQYLYKSVGSLFRQGIAPSSFEVLLINDGSKDNSLDICHDLAKKHEEIRVIDKHNEGIAITRNRGLDEARGEWIAFLDDDDYLLDNGFAAAFKPYMDRSDVDIIQYWSDYDFWPMRPLEAGKKAEGRAWALIKEDKAFLPGFLWTHFYRRSWIEDHHIRFVDVAMSDDYLFASSVYLTNPYLLVTKSNILRYVVHEGSGSTARPKEYSRKVAHDAVVIYDSLCRKAHEEGADNDPELWKRCLAVMNTRKRLGITRMLSSRYNRQEWKAMKAFCVDTHFYPVLGNRNDSRKTRLEIDMMNSIMNNYLSYRIIELVFTKIVEPYVLPRLRYRLK